jgi:uncharacterized membrane protein
MEIAIGLSLLAALLVLAGFKFSVKSRRPRLFKTGASVAATGIVLLWLLPFWLFGTDRGDWAMPMFIGVLFVAVSVLGGGLQLMRRASGGPEETENDRLFDDFLRQNDLP